jgi:hypothetical protein
MTIYYLILNDQVKEDEIGRTCSTHGENMKAYGILVGKPERKRLLGNIDVDGRIILKLILEG